MSDNEMINQDYILINREIDRALYYDLSDCIDQGKNNKSCSIFLTTLGGDPHAAFRMGRCVRNSYSHVKLIIPSVCKSAGTLFAICADELAIGDNGELGPLDIQVKKPEELDESDSGLVIINTINVIREHASLVFREVLADIRYGAQVSTRLAAEYAAKIAIGLMTPLC